MFTQVLILSHRHPGTDRETQKVKWERGKSHLEKHQESEGSWKPAEEDFRPTGEVKYDHPSSVLFSRSVVSNSLQPHGLQYARPPYPSPTPRVYSNSCALSW